MSQFDEGFQVLYKSAGFANGGFEVIWKYEVTNFQVDILSETT